MRIAHQIYNYPYEYTDSGTISVSDGIVLPDSDYCIMGLQVIRTEPIGLPSISDE